MPTSKLTDRLRATLQAEAEQIGGPDPDVVHLPTPAPAPNRPDRRRWLLAAAVLAAVVGAAGVVALRSGDERPSDVADGESTAIRPADRLGEAPEGVLAPGWVPDGLTLRDVSWRHGDAVGDVEGFVQLFGRGGGTDDGALLVEIQPNSDGQLSDGERTTVRGHEAGILPAKEPPDAASTISWLEAGAAISATFVGMSLDEARGALDDLVWRSADQMEGFAPPPDLAGTLGLLGEAPLAASSGTHGSFTYLAGDQRFGVGTSTGNGSMSSSYLQAWLHDTPGADGMVERLDTELGFLIRAWPDGRSVVVDALEATSLYDTLEQVADGVRPVSAAELVARRDEVAVRVAAEPLVASARFDLGALEVRGEGPRTALCLVPPPGDAGRVCSGLDDLTGTDVWVDLLVGDTWYIAAASTTGKPAVTDGAVEVGAPAPDGEWQFVLAAVPDDKVTAQVLFTQTSSGVIERP